MPYFLGIGAQKAGTSWLYAMLEKHPDILFPGGKEIHFWDYYYDNGLDWYYENFLADAPATTRQGEITPAYSILEPEQITEIHDLFPHLRIIYILRNPVERAWSSALMALQRAEMTIDEASEQWFIDHFRSKGSLRRGDYLRCLKNWLAIFPEDQLLVLRYEQISSCPRQLLDKAAQHIQVDTGFFRQIPDAELNKRIFGGTGTPLRPSLRLYLEELYRNQVSELSEFLGEDLPWLA
jgi:hypothetical protein